MSILPGDTNADYQVSVADIQAIAVRWGEPWSPQDDADQDGGDLDARDIRTAAASWWASVPSPCDQATTKYYWVNEPSLIRSLWMPNLLGKVRVKMTDSSSVHLGGRLIALRQNGQLCYVHTDHLGNLSLLRDGSG